MVICGATSLSHAFKKLKGHVAASQALREPGGCWWQRPLSG